MVDPRLSVIDKRFKDVKNIISIVSGKGGVGKSVIASTMALLLAQKGFKTGLLDLDFYGPSCHIVYGVEKTFPKEEKGLVPPEINGVKFMTITYFAEEEPVPLRGQEVTDAIIEILAITIWGELDYLIIDMPPGIGDEILDIIRLVKNAKHIVVTAPTKLAINVSKRLIKLFREINVDLIGLIENMVSEESLAKEICKNIGIKYLGRIRFDKNLENAIGDPEKIKETIFAQDLNSIVSEIIK